MTIAAILKIIALVCYTFIFWNGQMISIPMFYYLPMTALSFDFSMQQLSAVLGVIGLIILAIQSFYPNDKRKFLISVLVLLLLLSPIIQRLIAVPISLFNYPLFIVPCSLFLLSYLLFLAVFYMFLTRNQKSVHLRR